MLDFKSIPRHLQMHIVEKTDYIVQRELQLSSKLGKDAVNFTNQKAILDVRLTVYDDEKLFIWNNQRYWDWNRVRNFREFPLFKVSELSILMCASHDLLIEIDAKAGFMRSNISLTWDYEPISPSLFLDLPKIESVDLRHHDLTDETLLKLKAEKIVLRDTFWYSNMLTTANLFLQQWMQKERNISWLNIIARVGCRQMDTELLLLGLSFSIVKEYEEADEYEGDRLQRKRKRPIREALKFWIRTVGSGDSDKKNWTMNKWYNGDFLCTIDRGDKKLLIYASVNGGCIQAQEFDDLKEVFYLDEQNPDYN